MSAAEGLARAYLDAHPRRAARALARLPVAQAAAVLRAVPAPAAAAALRELTAPHAADCLAQLEPAAAAAIVAALTADDAAGVVRALAPARRDPLLAALPEAVRDPLARALPFPDGTAGAVMDPAIFHLPDDVLVADARARLARAARELLHYLYVVDGDRRLVGVLDIPELMLARPRDPLRAAMHRDVQRLDAGMPVALVREHAGWQRYHAMPVVDDDGRLVGAVRYQTLRRLERDAAAREADPARLTAGALAELFQLGTSGLVAGVAAASATSASAPAPAAAPDVAPADEVADAR